MVPLKGENGSSNNNSNSATNVPAPSMTTPSSLGRGHQMAITSFLSIPVPSSAKGKISDDQEEEEMEPEFRLNTMVKKRLVASKELGDQDADEDQDDDVDIVDHVNGKVVECIRGKDNTFTYQIQLPSTHGTGPAGSPHKTHRTKQVEEWTSQEVHWGTMLYKYIGRNVAKEFVGDDGYSHVYRGQVKQVHRTTTDHDAKEEESYHFRVVYEDGDQEDLDYAELQQCQQFYKEQCSLQAKQKQQQQRAKAMAAKAKTKAAASTLSFSQTKDNENRAEPEATTESPDLGTKPRRRAAASKRISYKEEDSDHCDDEDLDDDVLVTDNVKRSRKEGNQNRKRSKKAPTSTSSQKKAKTKIIQKDDDSESDFSDKESTGLDDDDDDDDDDDNITMDMMNLSEEEESKPTKGRKRASSVVTKKSKTAVSADKKKRSSSSRDKSSGGGGDGGEELAHSDQLQQELKKKLESERKTFDLKNYPQELPLQPFVDPVGVDPTHGIVEGIIADQVRKVGALLERVTAHAKDHYGTNAANLSELTYPIRLQTACSGTDAPSIALGIIKESLDRMYKDKPGPMHGFDFSHEMSCEIEPFKQAYIGRNFPGVLLFPDITKLTASEHVLDVYGRPQTIPDGNLFVAGTSCKDFSMLKTRDRQDIEDKGTSGETFLAAVEFLETKQPPCAIFENVLNAPWEKMQEYITGRIELSERNNTKAVKSGKGPANADRDLKFSVNEDNKYVAEEVPRQVGIRAGSVIQGFVKGGDESTNVRPMIWGDGSQRPKTFVTLGEIAKKHKINLETDILVLEKKARYCTRLTKLDTKDYGLPQTRNRKYLFIWRSDDPDDDLGDYILELMDHLKTPLLFSMDAFLLPDTHDRIRCFREALRSGPGLMVKRERAKELDFWDWELTKVLDLPRHLVFREKNGIKEKSRWLTGWDTRGRKSLAPGLWPELFDCWNMRRLDMIDCFAAANFRDSISRDPLHHFLTWDLSQNVTRTPYRSPIGVSACVTPGGELLMPHRGRTLMGYEKLLLQGIPFSRLLLGPETEVQLSDLAGNAMSTSVVCATMLSMICAPQLRRERQRDINIALTSFRLTQKHDAYDGGVLAERGDLHNFMDVDDRNHQTFLDVFCKVAKELAEDAFRSSVLCTCETSGASTKDFKILECVDCGMCICHSCSGRHRIESHNLIELHVCGEIGRPDSHAFERALRCAVPPMLRLVGGWEQALHEAGGLESYTFQLQNVDRKRGHWEFVYGAWEDHGSGRQVAEIRVIIGRTATLDCEVGVAAWLRCFAPAIKLSKPLRGALLPHATVLLKKSTDSSSEARWSIPTKVTECVLEIIGSDPGPSQRVRVGLMDGACEALKNAKVADRFVPKIKSRNSLVRYHPKWKTWPGILTISGDKCNRVNGKYKRLPCEHTAVHSAIWRRDASENQPVLYLMLRPNTTRCGLDDVIISTTPSYRDCQEICELCDWIPENAFEPRTHLTKAKFREFKDAPPNLKVEVMKPSMLMNMRPESYHSRLCSQSVITLGEVLCELSGLSADVINSLLEYNESTESDGATELDLVGRSRARNGKRLSIVAAPSLLKYAAEGKLPLTFSKWYRFPPSWRFGECETNVPTRPPEQWRLVPGRKMKPERFYNPEKSNEYYQKLQSRPSAFRVKVQNGKGQLSVIMNPCVAAHNAAAKLGGEKTAAVTVDYCLSELASMGEPGTKEFRVPNSDSFNEVSVDGLELPLYTRQAKALFRMLAIERGDVLFSEEERSEHVLPGIGWCLIARASKKSPLRGGVLGDAIGSGKTVVIIALIMHRVLNARKHRNPEEGRSGATLIVVPPGLVKQWDDERQKFTKDRLNCITIDCVATLKKQSVQDICSADIVIVPADIIEEGKGSLRPYTQHLSSKAGAGAIPAAPTYYSQREAPTIEGTWVRNMASGPEIYVGNNASQQARDLQAYYGHCYSEAVAKLRTKRFRPGDRGVPLEYFTWERVVVDECHETLVTGKSHEINDESFKAKARRGAREFLGVAQMDISKRPIVAAAGVWGLTGTPLLETEARVTELANLMGGTYLTGAAHHWRREERESGRDIFLNQQELTKSREYRRAVQDACHSYVKEACQRNRGEKLEVQLARMQNVVHMSLKEAEKFIRESSDISNTNNADLSTASFALNPDRLGDKARCVLSISAKSEARRLALSQSIESIHTNEPGTKIIVFANVTFGGYESALQALEKAGLKFAHLAQNDSVYKQNEIISWFRHTDATEEDRTRPRVLLLSFDQAAGHNFQEACHHVIIFDPMYSGTDAVADASVEEQAVGRVMRHGQKNDVTVTRLIVKGPNGERCLDDWILERNLDEEVLRAATSNFD